MPEELDCIVVGAGPGGLQAAIHLGRYNFSVLVLDQPGGRTRHARHIENFLGHRHVSGGDLVAAGIEQAKSFGARFERLKVETVLRREDRFEVLAGEETFRGRFVIAASGGTERYPAMENLDRFFGESYFTCVVCDGYRATGKKLLVIGGSLYGVRESIGMKQLFTDDVTFLAENFNPPDDHADLLREEGIPLVEGTPVALVGDSSLEGVQLSDGRVVPCDVIMGGHGFRPNIRYLGELSPEREAGGTRLRTARSGETSVPGLFAVGALTAGHSQAIISAGQGALAALEIAARLVTI